MIILGVDSSSVSGACSVVKDGKTLASGFINNGLTHSQTLLPMISETVKKSGINISDINLFAVTKGPGSFTGLRIGMATVKGMANATGKKCVAVSSLEAIAAGVKNFSGIICAVIDARCKQVYNADFEYQNGRLVRLCEDRALYIEDLKAELIKTNKPVIVAGDAAKLCFESFNQELNVCVADENSVLIHGEAVAALCEKYVEFAVLPKEIQPVYLRLPQAQRELLKKKGIDNK